MEIRYCLIQSPFHYGTSYLNDNLDYTPCNHKLDNLFGTVTRAARKSTHEIKLSIPVNQSGTRCFDYTLQVTTNFVSENCQITLLLEMKQKLSLT